MWKDRRGCLSGREMRRFGFVFYRFVRVILVVVKICMVVIGLDF